MHAINIVSDPFEIRKLKMQLVNATQYYFNPMEDLYTFVNRGHVIARRAGGDLEAVYFYLNLLGEHELMTKEQEQLFKVMEKHITLKAMSKLKFPKF